MVAQRAAPAGGASGAAPGSGTGSHRGPRLRRPAPRSGCGRRPPAGGRSRGRRCPGSSWSSTTWTRWSRRALGSPGRPAAGSVVRALEAVAREGERLGVHLVAAAGTSGRTAGVGAGAAGHAAGRPGRRRRRARTNRPPGGAADRCATGGSPPSRRAGSRAASPVRRPCAPRSSPWSGSGWATRRPAARSGSWATARRTWRCWPARWSGRRGRSRRPRCRPCSVVPRSCGSVPAAWPRSERGRSAETIGALPQHGLRRVDGAACRHVTTHHDPLVDSGRALAGPEPGRRPDARDSAQTFDEERRTGQ